MTNESTIKHFLDIDRLDSDTLRSIIERAKEVKNARKGQAKGTIDHNAPLKDKVLAMIFEKSSTRTRASFDIGMRQLGGQTMVLQAGDMQLGRGETVPDTARVISRFSDVIMLRTTSHDNLLEMAQYSEVPVINALTDSSHPCQLMADVLTFEEKRGNVAGSVWTWCGDGNNVAVSLIHAAVKFGFELRLACPEIYNPPQDVINWATAQGGEITLTEDVRAAAENSDCLVTDTWVSMGMDDGDERIKNLTPYQINSDIMDLAHDDALFMHCLPAHRGEEVTADIIDGPKSIVWDEAENRMHAQKAVLLWCLDR